MKCDSAIIIHGTPSHKSKHGTFQSTRLTNKEHQDKNEDQPNNGDRHRPHGRIQTVLLTSLFTSSVQVWWRRSHNWSKGNKKTKPVKIFKTRKKKNFVAHNSGTGNWVTMQSSSGIVVPLPLEMTKREDVVNYTQEFYQFFEWKQNGTVDFKLYKTMHKRERSRSTDEPFMQWPAVHRPRSLELWVHLRLKEKETEHLKIRPWGFHSIHCNPYYLYTLTVPLFQTRTQSLFTGHIGLAKIVSSLDRVERGELWEEAEK